MADTKRYGEFNTSQMHEQFESYLNGNLGDFRAYLESLTPLEAALAGFRFAQYVHGDSWTEGKAGRQLEKWGFDY